jgi:hypothetical protein
MVCFKKLVEADVANEALKRQVEPPSQKKHDNALHEKIECS